MRVWQELDPPLTLSPTELPNHPPLWMRDSSHCWSCRSRLLPGSFRGTNLLVHPGLSLPLGDQEAAPLYCKRRAGTGLQRAQISARVPPSTYPITEPHKSPPTRQFPWPLPARRPQVFPRPWAQAETATPKGSWAGTGPVFCTTKDPITIPGSPTLLPCWRFALPTRTFFYPSYVRQGCRNPGSPFTPLAARSLQT